MLVARPDKRIAASRGGFDNDVGIVWRSLARIPGEALTAVPDDLRGY